MVKHMNAESPLYRRRPDKLSSKQVPGLINSSVPPLYREVPREETTDQKDPKDSLSELVCNDCGLSMDKHTEETGCGDFKFGPQDEDIGYKEPNGTTGDRATNLVQEAFGFTRFDWKTILHKEKIAAKNDSTGKVESLCICLQCKKVLGVIIEGSKQNLAGDYTDTTVKRSINSDPKHQDGTEHDLVMVPSDIIENTPWRRGLASDPEEKTDQKSSYGLAGQTRTDEKEPSDFYSRPPLANSESPHLGGRDLATGEWERGPNGDLIRKD